MGNRGRPPRVNKKHIIAYYMQGYSQSAIARHYDVTRQYINDVLFLAGVRKAKKEIPRKKSLKRSIA